MAQEGMEGMIERKPIAYRAIIKRFIDGEQIATVLDEFKTEKEFDEWYKTGAAAYEYAGQGVVEKEEVFGKEHEEK